jgi:hypothetical protein
MIAVLLILLRVVVGALRFSLVYLSGKHNPATFQIEKRIKSNPAACLRMSTSRYNRSETAESECRIQVHRAVFVFIESLDSWTLACP